MRTFSIGEVEQMAQIKQHILRYWEESVPFLSPQKDPYGRRQYSMRDVQFILRLKYLLETEKCTLSQAQEQILHEIAAPENFESVILFNSLKTELLDLFQLIKNSSFGKQKSNANEKK